MRFMVTLNGPFEGGDPARWEKRTFTIGRSDPDELARDLGAWVHDVALRMMRGDRAPDETADEPMPLWEVMADAS